MTYIDGFLLPLPKSRLEEYKSMATAAGQIWREHGAVAFRECISEDVDVEGFVSFPKIISAEGDELVVFSYIAFSSREHRDEVNKKVMADPRLEKLCDKDNPPFDFKRMAYGGFQVLVDLP